MIKAVAALAVAGAAVVTGVTAFVVAPAGASDRPVVTGLSVHRGAYWGGTVVTVHGQGFTGAESVSFGRSSSWTLQVTSPTTLTAMAPWHDYDKVFVRVTTAAGRSSKSPAAAFSFVRPSLNDPIMGGMTARQEQHQSALVRANHKDVHIAHRSKRWTPQMGRSALRRAKSWIGTPYAWDGGNADGPSRGVCAHNGGDLDCHVIGFDCSGLTLHAWAPYEQLAHYTVTQHHKAGRFHPSIKQLEPGDLVFFSYSSTGTIDHTAVYAGKGMVIQAPESGRQVEESALADVISASGAYRGATRPMTTGPQGWGPLVTSVTRKVSSEGGTITITGHDLTGVTSVTVAHAIVYSFAAQTSRKLVLDVPAHSAGQVQVDVANAWDTVHRTMTYVAAG